MKTTAPTTAAERKRKERLYQQERINGNTVDWTVADCCLILSNSKYTQEQQFKAMKQLIKLKQFSKIKLLF